MSKAFWVDQDIEQLIGQLLRYGVVTASIIVLFGGFLYLYQFGQTGIPHYNFFTGERAGFTTMSEIVKGIGSFNAKGIIQLGVLALIATPISRIAFSLIGFIIEKDRLYILFTLIVLIVMMFSIFGLKA